MCKMMVFPGSFDPLTLGHVNLIERTQSLTMRLIVAVAKHTGNKHTKLAFEDRVSLASQALADLPWVTVQSFDGLLIDFLRDLGAKVILRGLRQAMDAAYEIPMALGNRALYPEAETCFLLADPKLSHVSSSWVKTLDALGVSVAPWIPPVYAEYFRS